MLELDEKEKVTTWLIAVIARVPALKRGSHGLCDTLRGYGDSTEYIHRTYNFNIYYYICSPPRLQPEQR